MAYEVKLRSGSFKQKPTITAGAYTAGKCLGGLLTFPDVTKEGQTGTLLSLALSDRANQKSVIDVWFFESLPATAFADAATFSPSNADLELCLGVVHVAAADYVSGSANAVATKANLILHLNTTHQTDPVQGARVLYAQLVCQGTPTYTSTGDIQLRIGVQQD